MNWKLTLAYDGTPYNGWQVQPGLPTVQGHLAAAIEHVTGETVLPQGSGRTDTGVHALGQVASFSLLSPIPAENLQRALNRALPQSIRILAAENVADDFHARHSAVRKTYEYRVFPRSQSERGELESICSPMLAPFVWDCPWRLDLARMKEASGDVVGERDFTSFAATEPDLANRTPPDGESVHPVSNVRRIEDSSWIERDGLYLYRVTGSGFLHHMVRNLVGTFVNIGASRLAAESIPGILAARSRSAAGPTAPARGLFLIDVEY